MSQIELIQCSSFVRKTPKHMIGHLLTKSPNPAPPTFIQPLSANSGPIFILKNGISVRCDVLSSCAHLDWRKALLQPWLSGGAKIRAAFALIGNQVECHHLHSTKALGFQRTIIVLRGFRPLCGAKRCHWSREDLIVEQRISASLFRFFSPGRKLKPGLSHFESLSTDIITNAHLKISGFYSKLVKRQ